MSTTQAFQTALSLAKQNVPVKLSRLGKNVWTVTIMKSIIGDEK